jgi:hypothetical protein
MVRITGQSIAGNFGIDFRASTLCVLKFLQCLEISRSRNNVTYLENNNTGALSNDETVSFPIERPT